jgi:hypothetical protein
LSVAQPFRAARDRSTRAFALLPFAIVLLPLFNVRLPFVRIASVSRTLLVAAIAAAAMLAASRTQRRALVSWLASPAGFFALVIVFAAAMSLGPEVHARGRVVADGLPYATAYRLVPGFDGVRVPARFGMVVAFGLAVLAALAIRTRRGAVVAGALIVLESCAVPIPIDQNDTAYRQPHLAALPDRVTPDDRRALDAFLAQLPASAAIVELPLGEPAFDVRYMFASTRHWTRLVNGYSGGAPADYVQLDQDLQDALSRPELAWQALVRTGATHVVVHEAYYADGHGSAMTAWLRAHGARDAGSFGSDRVLRLR